uniref:Uncharacterized protein n=1 Tax=Anguilla anguilla TaxID=7936 RepID=A0A0E9TUI8_ANGAN
MLDLLRFRWLLSLVEDCFQTLNQPALHSAILCGG